MFRPLASRLLRGLLQAPVTLSVIIPTMDGRGESLERAVNAYYATGPHDIEIIVVRNEVHGLRDATRDTACRTGDRLHFSADDLEPMDGWWQDALPWLDTHDELRHRGCSTRTARGTTRLTVRMVRCRRLLGFR